MKLLSPMRPTMILVLMLAISLISMVFIANPLTATAQTSVSQCNGTDNVGGQAVECHYTITNNLNGSVTSSTVTLTECHGAANDPATLVCTSSTTTSTDLVTSIDQCNGSGNGGGGTVRCTVDVLNNIDSETPTSATVNECNASGGGGGTAPTVLCDPFPANTTGATVTQCNSSGNGGGGTQRVQCTVDSDSTTTSILNVTVNQCVGSGNGGGATVTCRTGLTNRISAPASGGSSKPAGGGPVGGGPGTTGGGPGTWGPAGGATTSQVLRVPEGGDATTSQVLRVPEGGVGAGGGSTSGIENANLLLIGFILLAAGSVLVLRRAG